MRSSTDATCLTACPILCVDLLTYLSSPPSPCRSTRLLTIPKSPIPGAALVQAEREAVELGV